MWNTAIWRKTWGDQALLGLAFAVLWTAFPWLYIGLSAQIAMNAFQDVLLRAIPEDWQKMSGVPFSEVATHVGRVAPDWAEQFERLAAQGLHRVVVFPNQVIDDPLDGQNIRYFRNAMTGGPNVLPPFGVLCGLRIG